MFVFDLNKDRATYLRRKKKIRSKTKKMDGHSSTSHQAHRCSANTPTRLSPFCRHRSIRLKRAGGDDEFIELLNYFSKHINCECVHQSRPNITESSLNGYRKLVCTTNKSQRNIDAEQAYFISISLHTYFAGAYAERSEWTNVKWMKNARNESAALTMTHYSWRPRHEPIPQHFDRAPCAIALFDSYYRSPGYDVCAFPSLVCSFRNRDAGCRSAAGMS